MREHLTLATAPVRRVVTLQECKDNMRVDTDDEDALIESLISAAIEQVETITRRSLVNRTYDVRFDGLRHKMELPRPPLASVTGVYYLDDDEAEQTVAATVYDVDTYNLFGAVCLADGQSWPVVGNYPSPVRIRYVAGYGDNPQDVPDTARHAIMLLVATWFENREALSPVQLRPVPMGVDYLLAPLTVWSH